MRIQTCLIRRLPCAAGKTTTLQMLVGRMQPSGGGAVVRGGRSRLGFCPQQDALLELLTGAEQLALYARLKARPAALVGSTVRPSCRDLVICDIGLLTCMGFDRPRGGRCYMYARNQK